MTDKVEVKVVPTGNSGGLVFTLSLCILLAQAIWRNIPDQIWQVSLIFTIVSLFAIVITSLSRLSKPPKQDF